MKMAYRSHKHIKILILISIHEQKEFKQPKIYIEQFKIRNKVLAHNTFLLF